MAWYDVAVRHEWIENFSNNTYFRHEKTESLKFKLSAQYLSLFSMFFMHYKQNKYHNSN